jgi:hypothetical protein
VKSRGGGKVIGWGGLRSWLLGHCARFRSLRSATLQSNGPEDRPEAVEVARRHAIVDILKETAAGLSSGHDRGVVVFDGWADFGEWAALNCGRCLLCGTSRLGLGGRAPCAFLPRMLGRFIADGRVPMPVLVAIGGLVTGQGFELVGVRPVECSYIHRLSGMKNGKAVRDGRTRSGAAGNGAA